MCFLFAIGRRPGGYTMQGNTCNGEKTHYMKVKNLFYKIRLQAGGFKTAASDPQTDIWFLMIEEGKLRCCWHMPDRQAATANS